MEKIDVYKNLEKACAAIVEGEPDVIANLSNVCALIKEKLGFFWVGFYLVKKDQLVLGPFQGPVACTRINFGKGVCGKCWETKKPIMVPDVHEFEGHIACSTNSQSEIVFPIIKDGAVVMVLDIDSDKLNDFDENDMAGVESICQIVETFI